MFKQTAFLGSIVLLTTVLGASGAWCAVAYVEPKPASPALNVALHYGDGRVVRFSRLLDLSPSTDSIDFQVLSSGVGDVEVVSKPKKRQISGQLDLPPGRIPRKVKIELDGLLFDAPAGGDVSITLATEDPAASGTIKGKWIREFQSCWGGCRPAKNKGLLKRAPFDSVTVGTATARGSTTTGFTSYRKPKPASGEQALPIPIEPGDNLVFVANLKNSNVNPAFGASLLVEFKGRRNTEFNPPSGYPSATSVTRIEDAFLTSLLIIELRYGTHKAADVRPYWRARHPDGTDRGWGSGVPVETEQNSPGVVTAKLSMADSAEDLPYGYPALELRIDFVDDDSELLYRLKVLCEDDVQKLLKDCHY